jgi:hypothetical protein
LYRVNTQKTTAVATTIISSNNYDNFSRLKSRIIVAASVRRYIDNSVWTITDNDKDHGGREKGVWGIRIYYSD